MSRCLLNQKSHFQAPVSSKFCAWKSTSNWYSGSTNMGKPLVPEWGRLHMYNFLLQSVDRNNLKLPPSHTYLQSLSQYDDSMILTAC